MSDNDEKELKDTQLGTKRALDPIVEGVAPPGFGDAEFRVTSSTGKGKDQQIPTKTLSVALSGYSDEIVIKDKAGQVKTIGTSHYYLQEQFPNWKNGTQMVPTTFVPSVCVDGSFVHSEQSHHGDRIIYDLLKQLGNSKGISMFVVHGFKMKDVRKFPSFIIFHHSLGLISFDVNSLVDIGNFEDIRDAEGGFQAIYNVVMKFAMHASTYKDGMLLPHKKIVAMTSTMKSKFNHANPFANDILLLFADDIANFDSFYKWWQESLENSPSQMIQFSQEAYELALSYTLMFRHIGPLTEANCMIQLHQSLVSYKYHDMNAYPYILKKLYPQFWLWCQDVLNKVDDPTFNFGEGGEKLKEAFMKSHKMNNEELEGSKGIQIINEILQYSTYLSGSTPSAMDKVMAEMFEDKFFLFFSNIARFYDDIRRVGSQKNEQVASQTSKIQEMFPFLKLDSFKDLNKLDRHLHKSKFIEGSKPSNIDYHIFKALTDKPSKLPVIWTPQQLAVFEGPTKQLIIGPPGSGKTELMRFKALELENEMKAKKSEKKILYIVGNGSKRKDSLFFRHMHNFFETSTLIEVITVTLESEMVEHLELAKSTLKANRLRRKYDHVFIDEYWIGSNPDEHKVILKLIEEITGYVWISSVFDYDEDSLENGKKLTTCTKPLIMTLRKAKGRVSRITQVLRGTNSIIELEKCYSLLYQSRSYPYGTKEGIEGHSNEGYPVTWLVEHTVDSMYSRCVDLVESSTKGILTLDAIHEETLRLTPDDILVVNFAIRTEESLTVKYSLEECLQSRNIPFWTIECQEEHAGKMTLLQSLTRKDSTYLDGIELPMVIVILPSGLLLNTAKLAKSKGAEELRNYDPYISFFRALKKLIIISDKWGDTQSFTSDVHKKLNAR